MKKNLIILGQVGLFLWSCGVSTPPRVNLRTKISLTEKEKVPSSNDVTAERNDTSFDVTYSNDYRHFYGIAWRGRPSENLRYARQMGFEYVFYQPGMEKDANSKDMKFYLESPELNTAPAILSYPGTVDVNKAYSQDEVDRLNEYGCWKSDDVFPNNLATGWPAGEKTFSFMVDLQQQKVIDALIEIAVEEAKRIDSSGTNFKFAGFAWDEFHSKGAFFSHPYSRVNALVTIKDLEVRIAVLIAKLIKSGDQELIKELQLKNLLKLVEVAVKSKNLASLEEIMDHPLVGPIIYLAIPLFDPKASFGVPLSYWTNQNSCLIHEGITHEYQTYTDGLAAYFKALMKKVKDEITPEAKSIFEPYNIYREWIKDIEKRPDSKELIPDYLSQERWGTEFVNDDRIFASNLVYKNKIGSSSPDRMGEKDLRLLAGSAAINGAWFNWFGRFGGSRVGDMPNYQNIFEVPPRIQLVRLVPNWENLKKVPSIQRTWQKDIYESPYAKISPEVIYARHPYYWNKIYAVFLKESGKITLKDDERVVTIETANETFVPVAETLDELSTIDNIINTTEKTRLGTGYIITIER